MNLRPFASALLAAAAFAGVDACAHLSDGSVPVVTPTASPSATPSAAACTAQPSAGVQLVVISPAITPVVDPTYGVISGYGPVTNGNANNVAAPIGVVAGTTIQFFNNDVANSQLHYSAAGIPNVTAFPGPTYTFPPSASAAAGTQISATALWSTGLLGGQCYSQVFSTPAAGTYYFGDVVYYGLANVRDVIVVSAH